MLVPVISDFFNQRARPSPQTTTALEAIWVLIPTVLAGIISLTDTMARLLSPIPKLIPFLTPAPVLTAVAASTIVISRRKLTLIGPVYYYPEALRLCAKLFFAPLLAIAAISVWPLVPNALAGRSYVGGFICNGDTGHAISMGRVQVLDSARRSISDNAFLTDSIGFFYVDGISGSATKPVYLRFVNSDCQPQDILVDNSASAPYPHACPSDPIRERPVGNWPVWSIVCGKSETEVTK